MRVPRAIIRGSMRMAESSVLVLVMWLVVLLAALPMAAVMEDSIRQDIGSSLIHEDLRQGLDLGWLEEFQYRGRHLADTLVPVRLAPVMVLANLELGFDGSWVTENRGLAATGILFLFVWVLLQGGLLVHLNSPGSRFQWSSFLAAGGTYFPRFLRLGLLMGLAYYGVYKVSYWLFPAIDGWTRDFTVERTVLMLHLLGVGCVAFLLACVHLIADFAKIATIKEKRRSMLLAVVRSVRQIGRHPLQSFGLFSAMFLIFVVLQVLYIWLAPGVDGASTLALILAFGIGQVYLLVRWALRITRYAAEMELYEHWTGEALKGSEEPQIS